MSIETTQSQGVDGSIDAMAQRIEDVLTDDMAIDESEQQEEIEAQDVEDIQDETEDDQGDAEGEIVQLEAEQLASVLGIDTDALIVDDDGNVSLRTKVDGEESAATLQDILKGYQLEKHVQNKSQALAEQQRQFGEYTQQAQQAIEAQLNQAATILGQSEQQLLGQYQSIDWNTLRQQDPGEYAALQTQFQQAQANIEQMKQQAVATAQQQQAMLNDQLMQQQRTTAQQEIQMLRSKVPEWKDENTFKKEMGEIKGWLVNRGYPEEMVRSIMDHRFVLDAREFKRMLEARDKNTAPEKKVAKVQKPKARVNKSRVKAAQTRKRRNAIRSGDNDALVKEIESLL